METCYHVYTSRKMKSITLLPPEFTIGMSHWIRADRSRICQIVGNLLSNSCKFTEKGSIGIFVRNEPCTIEGFDGNFVISVKVSSPKNIFFLFATHILSFRTQVAASQRKNSANYFDSSRGSPRISRTKSSALVSDSCSLERFLDR